MPMPGRIRSAVRAATMGAPLSLVFAATAAADPLARTVARADAPRTELRLTRSLTAPGGGLIQHYSQHVGGLPVFGAETVAVAAFGKRSELISDSTVDGLAPRDTSGA